MTNLPVLPKPVDKRIAEWASDMGVDGFATNRIAAGWAKNGGGSNISALLPGCAELPIRSVPASGSPAASMHTAIVGGPASGKSTLIGNIVTSIAALHGPDQVTFRWISADDRAALAARYYPHSSVTPRAGERGGVVEELERRRQLSLGGDSIVFPLEVVVHDRPAVFTGRTLSEMSVLGMVVVTVCDSPDELTKYENVISLDGRRGQLLSRGSSLGTLKQQVEALPLGSVQVRVGSKILAAAQVRRTG